MEPKRYVITAATALALGYTAGFATDGLTEKEGTARTANVQSDFTVGAGATTQLENWITANACPAIVAAGAPSCVVGDVLSVRINRAAVEVDGVFRARVEAVVSGSNYQAGVELTSGQAGQLKTWGVNNACDDLKAKAPATTCAASNLFDIRFVRAADGWRARVEATFTQTCSEGSPE